jgi:acyl-homoserine-lactone acylase
MKKIIQSILFLNISFSVFAQNPKINPDNIQIARDSYGIPHIFAPTDPEVAYGLAWAHAEDDFQTIQTLLLTGKGKLGTFLGKKGAPIDYVSGLLNTKKVVLEQINSLDPKFISLIKGYLMGLEDYAKSHPKEVLNKHVFPISVEDYISTTMFSIAVFSGVERTLPQILNGSITKLPGFTGEGSNSFAVSAKKSASGEPMLVINAHQPIEGPTAFYEAHLQSDEGWNILGGLFPGAPLIFHGVTPNLAWAHTVNFQDKIDVYQLKIDKDRPNQYLVDGEWLPLNSFKVKLKIKGLPFSISKKAWNSIYGPTVKDPNGNFFSLRLPALMDAGALQQWYAMNRSKNFMEFKKALEQNHLAMFNILYADKEDNIFYVSNGKMPYRNPNPNYLWSSTLPGDTKETLWTEFKPFSALPQYLNPPSGYLFNTNHSPFLASSTKDNLNKELFDKNDGYETYHNNRSQRAKDLIDQLEKISLEDLKRIKFDRQLPEKILYPYGHDASILFELNSEKYPQYAQIINELKNWDHLASEDSKGALYYNMAYYLVPKLNTSKDKGPLIEKDAIEVIKNIHDELLKNFGTINLTLGQYQRLVRGKEDWPQAGMPDVLAAVMSQPWKDGKRRMNSGDAYIGFVKFPKDGGLPLIETVNTFGASSHPDSPHFADQRALYQAQKTKKMTLNKEEVLKNAKRIYHPK